MHDDYVAKVRTLDALMSEASVWAGTLIDAADAADGVDDGRPKTYLDQPVLEHIEQMNFREIAIVLQVQRDLIERLVNLLKRVREQTRAGHWEDADGNELMGGGDTIPPIGFFDDAIAMPSDRVILKRHHVSPAYRVFSWKTSDADGSSALVTTIENILDELKGAKTNG
jgi:hypothetical protein